MFKALRRDIYSLCTLGYPIERMKLVDSDSLVTSCYLCIYWIDHLCDWNINSCTNHRVDLQDGGVVDVFIRKKYLYWLEALSLCRSMSDGLISLAKLEALVQVTLSPAMLCIVYVNTTLEESRCIRINRASSRCAPIHYVSQAGNREQSSSGICVCTHVQSSP